MFGFEPCPLTRRRFLAAAGLSMAATGVVAAGRARAGPAKPPKATVVSDQGGVKTYLLVFAKGQPVMAGLLAFAKRERLTGGSLSAIGAVRDTVLAFFDRKLKDYQHLPQKGQTEVVALTGNLVLRDGEPFLHVHPVLGLPDGSTRAGT